MKEFEYQKVKSAKTAISLLNAQPNDSRFLAGGTTLIDLMKLNVEVPNTVVDINHLPYDLIEEDSHTGEVKIGALVRNSDLAAHPLIKANYAVLSEALLSGATPQLRNLATTGGNLLQRTRCPYFRDVAFPCNKRQPGAGCPARKGANRTMAIFGGSDACIAVNPSDMNVALLALNAKIHLLSSKGSRVVSIEGFHTLPEEHPETESILAPGELITFVTLPKLTKGTKSSYLKLRDRAAYEFALTSIALVAEIENDRFKSIRIALGGVGTVPWHAKKAEDVLLNQIPSLAHFQKATEAELATAEPLSQNKFKVELVRRSLPYALAKLTGLESGGKS